MPAYFTASTPLEFIEFDYDKLFNEIKKTFGYLPFFKQWRGYWTDIFLEMDSQIKRYKKQFPNSNPVIQRFKHGLAPDNYETYVFEHITAGGSYYLHFDVEKMKHFQKNNFLTIETFHLDDFSIDKETPLIKSKVNDTNLPFFVRMYGIEKPFICVDGNKRIQARIHDGQQSFKGYFFEDKVVADMFFGAPDLHYYIFLRELEHMALTKDDATKTESDVYKTTQMYLQEKVNMR